MPLQYATNPETKETVVLVNGQWTKADQVAADPSGAKAYLVGGKWLSDQAGPPPGSVPPPGQPKLTKAEESAEGKSKTADFLDFDQWKQAVKNVAQTGASMVSGAGATLVGAGSGYVGEPIRYAGEQAASALGLKKTPVAPLDPHGVMQSIQQQYTYQPTDESGKQLGKTLGYLPGKVLEGVEAVGGPGASDAAQVLALGLPVKAAKATRGGAIEDATAAARAKNFEAVGANVARRLQGKPTQPVPPIPTASQAGAAAAQAYVERLGLAWDTLSEKFKDTLSKIGAQAKNLDNLDPVAVKRVARADQIRSPITRGQATRKLVDITDEENLKRTAAGEEIRKRQAQQDTALHDELSAIRKKVAPGSKVEDASDVGASLQGAARRKLQILKAQASVLYDDARAKGEMAKPVDPKPLAEWMAENPGRSANVGWITERMKAYADKAGTVTLENLENLRGEVSAAAGESGRKGHFAGQALAVLDQVLDSVDSASYKAARGKWREMKEEFDRQSSVRDLTSEKANTTDRRIALEDTLNRVIRGSNEGLNNIKSTLLRGGTAATRRRGARAWRDLQAGVIEHLREAAAGKRKIKGEDAQLQFNSAFLDTLNQLQQGGKLETLFGKEVATRVTELAETVRDLRTTPADRVVGPQTALRIFRMLEHAAAIPGVKHVVEFFKERKAKSRAETDPVTAAAKKAKRPSRTAATARVAAPLTLQDQYRDDRE